LILARLDYEFKIELIMKKSLLITALLLSFVQCRESEKQLPNETAEKKLQGLTPSAEAASAIAMEAQAALGRKLMEHLQSEGVAGAISYCNANALPVTDSISRLKGVTIQRITDKPRNSANSANPEEIALMSRIRNAQDEEILPADMRIVEGDAVVYYVPIKTADFCLKCHGTPGKELDREAAATISSFYPKDLATGYSSNELRGLWKVAFNTKSNQ
jgi:hypothetical protein